MFKNSSDEYQCSGFLVIMCSRVQPVGHTPYILVLCTVSAAVAVSVFRDVIRPGRPKCRQQLPCSHNPEDHNLHHNGCNITKSRIIQSRFLFKRLKCVSRALD